MREWRWGGGMRKPAPRAGERTLWMNATIKRLHGGYSSEAERLTVAQDVVGSIPTSRPKQPPISEICGFLTFALSEDRQWCCCSRLAGTAEVAKAGIRKTPTQMRFQESGRDGKNRRWAICASGMLGASGTLDGRSGATWHAPTALLFDASRGRVGQTAAVCSLTLPMRMKL